MIQSGPDPTSLTKVSKNRNFTLRAVMGIKLIISNIVLMNNTPMICPPPSFASLKSFALYKEYTQCPGYVLMLMIFTFFLNHESMKYVFFPLNGGVNDAKLFQCATLFVTFSEYHSPGSVTCRQAKCG